MKNEHSSRRDAFLTRRGILTIALALFFVTGIVSCKKEPVKQIENQSQVAPKVDIRVDKRYDEKGNIIGFDSLYSSYYQNFPKDKAGMDSLFRSFHHSYLEKQPGLLEEPFNKMFFHDSLLYSDFFHKDFFSKRYEMNDLYMRRMMHELDSIKNRHYQELSKQHKMLSPKK